MGQNSKALKNGPIEWNFATRFVNSMGQNSNSKEIGLMQIDRRKKNEQDRRDK
jgi:hypothetical protein